MIPSKIYPHSPEPQYNADGSVNQGHNWVNQNPYMVPLYTCPHCYGSYNAPHICPTLGDKYYNSAHPPKVEYDPITPGQFAEIQKQQLIVTSTINQLIEHLETAEALLKSRLNDHDVDTKKTQIRYEDQLSKLRDDVTELQRAKKILDAMKE